MPKFEVAMNVTRPLQKKITVYADDEAEAMEKATDIVLDWDGIVDADAVGAEEV